MSEKRPIDRKRLGKRIGLMVVAGVIAVLGMAWFHGGEEPLRPIVQPIDMPENVQ